MKEPQVDPDSTETVAGEQYRGNQSEADNRPSIRSVFRNLFSTDITYWVVRNIPDLDIV
jgi:hypothetical protein